MAYFGVTASEAGLQAAVPGEDLEAGLRRRLARRRRRRARRRAGPRLQVPPRRPRRRPAPLALRAPPGRRRPRASGAGPRASASATTAARAASASASPGRPARRCSASLVTTGRTGFARVYDRAAAYGARLAELVALLQRLAPGRPVDLLAHSLGARVALAALPALAERAGAGDPARRRRVRRPGAGLRRAPPRAGPPQIYNVTARANDLYDLAFETFAPRRARGERALGLGLGAPLPYWLDLQLDRAEVTAWVNGLGIPLTAVERAALPLGLLHPRRGARGLRGDPAPPARLGHREPARRPLLRGAGAALEPAAAAPPGACRGRRSAIGGDLTRA